MNVTKRTNYNRKQGLRFWVFGRVSIAVIAVTSLSFLVSLSTAQNPNPKATPQSDNKDCENLKKQISDLQDLLVLEGKGLGQLEQLAEEQAALHRKALDEFNKWAKDYSHISGFEEFRAKFLDDLTKGAESLRLLRDAVEEAKRTLESTKEELAKLVNKLGNCSAKASTPTPSPSPKQNPTPTPNPPENKNVGLLPGYHVVTNTADGLFVTVFDTPQGKIKVNLPDDMAAGDTISGTVETEPAGKDDAERAKNEGVLNGEVIDIGGQKTKVGDKKIFCNIPNVLTNEAKTIVLQHNGQPVATTLIPISNTPAPTPNQLTLPTGGQQGKTIECRGNFAPTDQVKIGGTIMPSIAQSPRKLVVRNTSETVGPTTIECAQHGVASECPFRNIGIKLSAPKLNLRRGETTTLHVVVTGLGGITKPVSVHLESTGVVTMSGGNVQDVMIQTGQVQQDGTAAFDRTLTGNTTGGFGVTATAKLDEVCKHP